MDIEGKDPVKLKVVTPLGVVVEQDVVNIKVPMANGEIGVFPGHVSYVGLVGTGIFEFQSGTDESVTQMVISGGFCNLADQSMSVLTDEAYHIDDIDTDTYAEDREEMKSKLKEGHYDDPERVYARRKLALISAIDKLISH